jgi:hypothetical protein
MDQQVCPAYDPQTYLRSPAHDSAPGEQAASTAAAGLLLRLSTAAERLSHHRPTRVVHDEATPSRLTALAVLEAAGRCGSATWQPVPRSDYPQCHGSWNVSASTAGQHGILTRPTTGPTWSAPPSRHRNTRRNAAGASRAARSRPLYALTQTHNLIVAAACVDK